MSAFLSQTADTIYARATTAGRSAIAILRISGPLALDTPKLFHVKPISERSMRFARLKLDDGSLLDEVMLLSMPAPHSPTGEAVLEIHCHGSPAIIAAIMRILGGAPGYRPAEAGEFSKRAFANGRMDLTELEALADLIAADTESQRRQASRQLGGALRAASEAWRQTLIGLGGQLEALIDFADEDLPPSVEETIRLQTDTLIAQLNTHLSDGGVGEKIRDGVQIALIGPVNAGKSTTLNALARRPAAIISDQAGTTRDVIEVQLDIGGVSAILRDTAGYRQTDDAIEQEGIKRARLAAEEADLVILIVDISDENWRRDYEALKGWALPEMILVGNKADKLSATAPDLPEEMLCLSLGGPESSSEASHSGANESLVKIETALHAHLADLQTADNTILITRARHRHAFIRAVQALQAAQDTDLHSAPELAAEHYREAAEVMARITGQIDVEDLLDHIFGQFCIGK